MLIHGAPAAPLEVEARIRAHLDRWVDTKPVQHGIEVGRRLDRPVWGGAFERWLEAKLEEVQADWRDYYSASWSHLTPEAQRWLSETTISTAHARVALADSATPPSVRLDAERLIADARSEARRRGVLPALSRSLDAPNPETYAKSEIDEYGRLFLPKEWHGRLLREGDSA
jgi:hypothetical protein